jgi:uncharacterized membrane protein YbhN (UPF0104 family)
MSLSRPKLALSIGAALVLAAIAASPQLLGHRVVAAVGELRGADPNWLWLSALGFALAFACTVCAWCAALAAAGGRICPRQAAARLGVGCLVNSVAPAKLGDAVKIALCSRAIDDPGRIWTTGGVYAALAAARSLTLAVLVVVASITGALPLWPVFALCGMVAALVAAGHFTGRLRNHERIAKVLAGLLALERSPRAIAKVLGWSFAMTASRLAATIAAAAALGLPHPVLAGLVIMPALDVAAAVPLTPGSIGVGSGAVAVALASRGIGMSQALGVGIAIQALETLVSVGAGSAGALYLLRPTVRARRWALRGVTLGASAAAAAVVGAIVLNLT